MLLSQVSVDELTDNTQRVGFLAAALQHQLLSNYTESKHKKIGARVTKGLSASSSIYFEEAAAAAANAEAVALASAATIKNDNNNNNKTTSDGNEKDDAYNFKRASFSATEADYPAVVREEAAAAAEKIEILQKSLVDLDKVVLGLKSKETRDCKREMRRLMRRRAKESRVGGDGDGTGGAQGKEKARVGGGSNPAALQLPSSDFFMRDEEKVGTRWTAGPNQQIVFPFYSKDPIAREAKSAFRSYAKAHEIQLRFNSISTWDETHAKVLDILTDEGHRDAISLAEYKEAMVEFEEWCAERGFAHILPRNQSIRHGRCFTQSALAVSKQPGLTLALFYSCPAIPKDDADGGGGGTAPGWESAGGKKSEDDDDDEETAGRKEKGMENGELLTSTSFGMGGGDPSTDDDTLARTINTAVPHKVDARALFARYVKSISIVKTEAELIMCDEDYDGKITLAELEGYIAEIIPTVASLQQLLPEDMIPYYTCSSARRLFWLLDPSNRGVIKISSLITNPVLDDWLDVQMTADEQPRNWFGATIAMQLREKFEILDIFCTSSLSLECMKRYKKGIPMVVDDGLPKDVSPLSSLFLERVFDTTNPPQGKMDYAAFVDFVVAIEFLPNSCPRPLFFWRIFDIFGEGRITPLVVHSFFKETYAKLKSAEVEVAPIEVIIQELFDLIPTREPLVITKEEFVSSNQCGLFSALVVDCLAFYTYENREHK